MQYKRRKSYRQLYWVILLVIILAVVFSTSWWKDFSSPLLGWRQNILPHTVPTKVSVDLGDFYYFENLELKKRLTYQAATDKQRSLFLVLNRGRDNIYDTFTLSDPQGILEPNDLVLGTFNFALGEVVVSEGGVAKTKLFSAVGEKNTFSLVDSEQQLILEVEAVGQGGGLLEVRVEREIDPTENTVLKLLQDEEYLVAKLVKEEFIMQDPYRVLSFQILVSPYSLNYVEVEK